MTWFDNILRDGNVFLSVWILIPLLIIAGIYFSFKTKFVQFRLIKDAFKSLTEKADEGKVSSFQSLMISTASRVGVGHIAGIASAIIIGGAGSVFWMWVMAILGSASAFIESTLAQIYKTKYQSGFRGGPSYYMQRALGKKGLGVFFSILLIAGYAYGFNALQAFQMSSALEYYIPNYKDSIFPLVVGLCLAAVTALVIWGGVHRIGFISSTIVPIMAIAYILLGVIVAVKNYDKIPGMFVTIFKEAFNFKAMFGAVFYKSALMMGIKRGLFSNEAGMGSAPNVAATADVNHPVNQGLAQVLSVFIDTLIICSTTAFIVLLSGVNPNSTTLNEIPFVQQAVNNQVGPIGIHIIAFSIFAFAFTSIIGNYCYAETNVLFIKNNKVVLNAFRVTCIIAVFLGTQANAQTVWNLSDVLMGLMATVNIIVILIIGNTAIKALDDYVAQKKNNKVPEFKGSNIGLHNLDCWK